MYYNEPIKNESFGDSYFIAALSTMSHSKPDTIRNMFLTGTIRNEAGLYGVRFYVRGKPWVVVVDDHLLFDNRTGSEELLYGKNRLELGMWVPILEKAWAKVKGTYEQINGGPMQTGLKALTGAPVFSYSIFQKFGGHMINHLNRTAYQASSDLFFGTSKSLNSEFTLADLKSLMTSAQTLGYPMGAFAADGGCGNTDFGGHSYSVLSVFEISEIVFLMLRDPRGPISDYTTGI